MPALLVALDWAIIHQRGLRFSYPISIVALRFTPPLRCAGASVVRPCPSPVGRAQSSFPSVATTSSVLGAPPSLIGSEYHGHRAPALGLRRGYVESRFQARAGGGD